MKTLNAHILRVAIALWLFALPITAKESKANAAQFHSPQQESTFLESIFRQQKTQYTRTSSAAMPAMRNTQSGGTTMPVLASQNTILQGRHISYSYTSSGSRMPVPQMHSVAVKLRETSRSNTGYGNNGGCALYAGAETASNTMHSSNITPVGAGNATAMYALVTPPVRKAPPGTGGGNPENPDIPVPVGEGVLTLLTAAGLFALQKRKQHS